MRTRRTSAQKRGRGRGDHPNADFNTATNDADDENNGVAALEEKYARRLSVGCRRRNANFWSTPREKRREEEEEEDDDDDALFSVPVKVEREEEEDEEKEEEEDGKEMMVFRSTPLNAKRRREKIREANARLDEDVRRVRDVMEELLKAGDTASEYRYREDDEEENGRGGGEERVPVRDDETSEELRLRKGLVIASSSTLTRKGASYWSVPAEDLVRQLVGEDDAKKGGLSAKEEPDDAGIQIPRRIDAESLRTAGIL